MKTRQWLVFLIPVLIACEMKLSIKTKIKESKSSQPELGKLAIDLLYKLPELFCEMIIPYTCHEVP